MSYLKEAEQAFTELVYDTVMVQLFKYWLIEESHKAVDKAYHVGRLFNLGYKDKKFLRKFLKTP